jgi:hypothetical protein
MKRKTPPTLDNFKNRKLKQQKKNHFNDFLSDDIQEMEVLQIVKSSESRKSILESKKELELLVQQFLKYISNSNTLQIVHFLNKNSKTLKVEVSLLTSKILCFIFKKQNPHVEVIFYSLKFSKILFSLTKEFLNFQILSKKNFLENLTKETQGKLELKTISRLNYENILSMADYFEVI